MNKRNPELAARIEDVMNGAPSTKLVLASLSAVARTPWERYCGDGKARRMCSSIATSEMTALHLDRCGFMMPEWHGDVGGVARLALLLDAGAGVADGMQARSILRNSRDALLDALLAPVLNSVERVVALGWNPTQKPARPQRRRANRPDFSRMAEDDFKNRLNAIEVRAFYSIFCRATGKEILDAVMSSSGIDRGVGAEDLRRYAAHVAAEPERGLHRSFKVMCCEYLREVGHASDACDEDPEDDFIEEPEDWRDTHDVPWSRETELKECLMRRSLSLFFEPVALAYGVSTQEGHPESPTARPNPTLAARLASAQAK